MTCPKCGGNFVTVAVGSIEVDRCGSCGGLWFDILEHEDLKAMAPSEGLDTGATPESRRNDEQMVVSCPRDGSRMLRMVDATQPHIWLESCPLCHGTYLDAGEFRDLKEHTLMEWVTRRRRPRRP